MKLWRATIRSRSNGTSQRVGFLLVDGRGKLPPDLTAEVPKDATKHFKLDWLLAIAEVADGIELRSVGGRAVGLQTDDVAPMAVQIWKAARSVRGKSRVKVNGKEIDVTGRNVPVEGRPSTMLSPEGLATLIAEKNRSTWPIIVQSLKSNMGVIPFVGAGLSAAFGFPQWGDLLKHLARPSQKKAIAKLVEDRQYEDAAEKLYDKGRTSDRLQSDIHQIFGKRPTPRELAGTAVAVLPHLTVGPVITTNYDHVLETAFEGAGRKFSTIVLGAEPDELVPAIQRNERVLFKIHGDCQTRRGLTLTLSSYDYAYGEKGRGEGRRTRDKLKNMLPILIMNRPLLFLGCSLETDRTLEVVRAAFKRHARIEHYAVMAADYDTAVFDAREERLEKIGIRVLWYRPGEHQELEALLRGLLDSVAVEDLDLSKPPGPASPTLPPLSPLPESNSLPLPGGLRTKIRSGALVYFLGAAAAGTLLGDPFYEAIARSTNAPSLKRSRSDVAQFIIDKYFRDVNDTREVLAGEILDVLRKHFPRPSPIHRRLVDLASVSATRFIVMTTNYDTGLETAFEEAGQPHHVLVYQAHGPHVGRIIHRTPLGKLRVVVAPEKMLDTGDGHPVIFKMNGGPRLHRQLHDTFAVATRDFYNLAALVPRAFPAFIQRELETRSLLFLGHGLKEPDVEEVIRFRQRHGGRSWALKWSSDPSVLGPDPSSAQYWNQINVELLWGDLAPFMQAIDECARPRP